MKHPVVTYFENNPADTPNQFAKRSGMGYQTVYNMINGHQSNYMRPETMVRLVEGSNGQIRMAELLEWNARWTEQLASQSSERPKKRRRA